MTHELNSMSAQTVRPPIRESKRSNVIRLRRHAPNFSLTEAGSDWDALTVAKIRQQHASGELNPAILDAMMSAIGLPT
jgi:hypothetical protein